MPCSLEIQSVSFTPIGSFGGSLTVVVPEVYPCTNIQVRFRSSYDTIYDWEDFAVLSSTSTTFALPIPSEICHIDVRLYKCCAVPPGPGPDTPDDPPCAAISESFEAECSTEKQSISNGYVKPSDVDITTPKNDIYVPKKVKLTITQDDCSNIEALLCTVRCGEPPPDPPDLPTGSCPCNFRPVVDIYTLPQTNIGRIPHGVPIDIDLLCTYSASGGIDMWRPQFPSNYTKFVILYQPLWGYATPFIDGIGYRIDALNRNTWVHVRTTSSVSQARSWLTTHFRFFTLDPSGSQIQGVWPYTDLYHTPYNFCTGSSFTAEADTVYIKLIPC